VKSSIAGILFVILLVGTLQGAEGWIPERENPLLPGTDDVEIRTLGLTLEECVNQAYLNNITLQNSRQALESRKTFIGQAKGAFDPEFFASLMGSEDIRPVVRYDPILGTDQVVRTILDTDQDLFMLSSGFRGLLLSGADYTLTMNVTRSYLVYSGESQPVEVRSDVGIDIRQPLLKRGWTAYTRSEAVQAGLNSQAEALALETTLSEVIYNTIEAYWNLVFSHEDLKAKEKSMELSKDLLYINTRKKEEGVFSKIEVLEAEADVAIKKEELITARNSVLAAEDALKRLIFPFEEVREWDVTIMILTEAQETTEQSFDLNALLAESLEHRPDYQQLEVDLKVREVDLMKAQNELMPNLDMTGAWRYNGLGTNMGNTFDPIEERRFRYFSVGLEFSYPLGNRAAKNALRRAEVEYQRGITSMKDLEIQIVHDIRDAIREIEMQREKVIANRESLKLSSERYEGEKKRLEAGISIPYQVREAERNLLRETVNQARAILDYQIALAKLSRAKGTLLAEYGIFVPRPELKDFVGRMF
jgi:outer membrane protein TolC